jgi:hypothetical protein
VFDVEYELESGEGKRNKITFISWCPDDAPQYVSVSFLSFLAPLWPVGYKNPANLLCVAKDDVFLFEGGFETRT